MNSYVLLNSSSQVLLPLSVHCQYAVGPSFGGGCGGGCPRPMCNPRPICAPPPMPICPPPAPCPPQFCPPPPICPPPPPPLPCPPPPPPPSCGCAQQQMYYPTYQPMSYGGGCGAAPRPYVQPMRAQNDCCCGCSSPCRFKSRRRVAAFGSKTVDPACNNEKLRSIIEQYISSEDASESKRSIQREAEKQLGHAVNVICGKEFTYVAHTDTFCQTTKDNITCYAFRPF